jgi:arsenate reductase
VKLLEQEGVDFERVNYFVEALDESALAALLRKADLSARDVLRTRDKAYRELGLDDDSLTDGDILRAIVQHPGLLQRPIVERGERAVLARPIEAVRALL